MIANGNNSDRAREQYSRLTLLTSLFIWVFVCSVFIRHQNLVAPEPAVYLQSALLTLQGQRPNVDFILTDWPSTILTALPAAALSPRSRLLPAFNLFALMFSLASIALVAKLLLPLRHHRQWQYFPPLILSLSLANAFLIFQIGQPQYFAFFAIIPHSIVRWLRYQNITSQKYLSIAGGLIASIGLQLCPFACTAPLLVELYLLANFGRRTRIFCGETVTLLAATTAYLCLFFIFSSADQKQNFLSIALPLMSVDWQFIDFTSRSKIDVPDRRDLLTWGGLFFLAAPLVSRRFSFFVPQLLLFISGSFAVIVEQNGLSRNCILMTGSLCMLSASTIAFLIQLARRLGKKHSIASIQNRHIWLPVSFLLPVILSTLIIIQCETKIAPPLWKETDGTIEPLHAVLAKHSKSGDQICFFQRSTFPEYPTLLELNSFGASALLTPGSALANDRALPNLSTEGVEQTTNLDARIGAMCKAAFIAKPPDIAVIEQGAMQTKLTSWGIQELLARDYTPIGTYQSIDRNAEPHETIGPKEQLILYRRNALAQPPVK